VTLARTTGRRPHARRAGLPQTCPFVFADRGLAEALAAERDEPAWLRDERLAAFDAFESLPVESNQLYTPYIDLRAADLFAVRPFMRTASASSSSPTPSPPFRPGRAASSSSTRMVSARLGCPRRPGLAASSSRRSGALARDAAGFRAELEGVRSSLASDKLAMLTRAFWSQGVRLIVPAGVSLDEPFVLRWAAGAPDRALLTRTSSDSARVRGSRSSRISGGRGGQPRVGERRPVAVRRDPPRSISRPMPNLRVASIQDFGPSQIVLQHRQAAIGAGANLHWALAQLGGRLVRSRVDNRLEGDRSSVEQVEIVFGADEQLFDLTSYTPPRRPRYDRQSPLEGRPDRCRPELMKGMITIDKTAVGTDSFLGEFGMNLSKKTPIRGDPKPRDRPAQLPPGGHSSSVGPIDETQLFYLESRGIPPDEARKFIVLGFPRGRLSSGVPLDESGNACAGCSRRSGTRARGCSRSVIPPTNLGGAPRQGRAPRQRIHDRRRTRASWFRFLGESRGQPSRSPPCASDFDQAKPVPPGETVQHGRNDRDRRLGERDFRPC